MKRFLMAAALALATSASMAANTNINGMSYSNPDVKANGSFFTTLAAGTYTFAFDIATFNKTTLDAVWLSTSGDRYTNNGNDFHVFNVTPGATTASGSWTQAFNSATKVFFNVDGMKNKNTGYSVDYTITPVPEPTTTAMFLAGLGALGLMLRRRKPL